MSEASTYSVRSTVRKVDHVGLAVSELDEEIPFLAEVLGSIATVHIFGQTTDRRK